MKSPKNPTQKCRPYDAPMLTRQNNLKSITLFTSFDGRGGSGTGDGGGGEPRHQDNG